jgi:hypothetical protein
VVVRRRVDVVCRPAYRRYAARDQRLAQSLGRERQIGHRAEAAEALAEDAPPVDAKLASDPLGVAHDGVGTEMLQVVRLLSRAHAGQDADRAGAARTALVEQQHAEVAQRAIEPRRATWVTGGSR